MKKQKILQSVLFLLIFVSGLSAQVESPAPEKKQEWLKLWEKASAEKHDFTGHLAGRKTEREKINAVRTGLDFNWKAENFVHYSVPPMSNTQYLPDVYPFDGEAGVPLRILAAGGEYEPGSFILYPLKNLGKVQFQVSDLKDGAGNVFAKENLDLTVVKVWYQNGNGWYSYFQDNGWKLCPELLLHDEDLIRVDTEKKANYARLTAPDGTRHYRWLTPPRAFGDTFACMKPDFTDSDQFCGATLEEGKFKQFFLTARVKKEQKPGLYKGQIRLEKEGVLTGVIPVELRVLPFLLPEKPKTYSDLSKDYRTYFCEYISLEHIRNLNGNDAGLAEKQLLSLLKNFAAHGETLPSYRSAWNNPEFGKAAGMEMKNFPSFYMLLSSLSEMRFDARRKKEQHLKKFGTAEGFYGSWGDEYGLKILRGIRPMIDIYKDAGFRFVSNSRYAYALAGFQTDLFWPPVNPDFRSHVAAEKLNFLGDHAYFGWYACQHVGVENPAYIRRQYGLGPYRAGFSCNYNYAHHLNGYNDIAGGTYRSMNFVYGSGSGVIDTLSWEAFRESQDDLRYATLLQMLARPLTRSKDRKAKYAAKKALRLLADMNTDDFDLSAARLEMIRHIRILQDFSRKGESAE